MNPPSPQQVMEETRCWVETMVIGLNLCPFAARPWNAGQVHIEISQARDDETLYQHFLAELNQLLTTDADILATTLLVAPYHLHDFNDYLDFADMAQQAISEAELDGVFQLATFHPDYLFEGEPVDAASHFTNRSPYPTLHLIREEQVEAAIASHPDAESIPAHNIDKLEALGIPGIMERLHPCRSRQDDKQATNRDKT